MRSRWLSTFTVIGVLLIGLGIAALVVRHSGHRFVFDPGQVETGREPFYYIIVGVLMVVNGIMTPLPDVDADNDDGDSRDQSEKVTSSGSRMDVRGDGRTKAVSKVSDQPAND